MPIASSSGPGRRSGVARLNWKTTSAGRSGSASEKIRDPQRRQGQHDEEQQHRAGQDEAAQPVESGEQPVRLDLARLISAHLLAGRLEPAARRRRCRHQTRDAVIHHAHEFEAREVGERPDADMAFAALHDFTDWDADREAAAVARGHDAVATLHARHALQQVEAQLRGVVADQDGFLARALDLHRQAAN